MSVSFPDCFSDLLCDEDSGTILTEESPVCSSDIDSSSDVLPEDGMLLTELVRGEMDFVPGIDYVAGLRGGTPCKSVIFASAREESVAWIIKPDRTYTCSSPHNPTVHAMYRFQPLTAYLSVNYMDRFLYSRCLPQSEYGWPMQLLSVASLSLAAKMEEPLVPSLLDLQVEGAKYVFEPRTIRRMELLVLKVLDWRLRTITPFCFISFLAFKVDPSGTFAGLLVSHATEVILSNIQEFSFLEYRPSSIAAAVMVCAANTIPSLSLRNPGDAELWCSGLIKEEIVGCYRLLEASELKKSKRKAPKVLPQFRVTTRAGTRYSDTSSSSSSSSSYNKRRKLNMCLWVDDDEKDNSSEIEHEERE